MQLVEQHVISKNAFGNGVEDVVVHPVRLAV